MIYCAKALSEIDKSRILDKIEEMGGDVIRTEGEIDPLNFWFEFKTVPYSVICKFGGFAYVAPSILNVNEE